MIDFSGMTALDIGTGIKNGDFTSPEVAEALFDAIAKKDDRFNAYITVCGDEAIEKAKEVQKLIEKGKLASPLAGVPISIKDNICTKGIKTSCASKILGEFKPPYNATVIERLQGAGLVVAGKLNMDEFAMGSTCETSYYGAARNPWDTDRVPGGSSGGAAAAIAAAEAVCALGSDTGGSIRQPAAYCGTTGFKPTYGAVSRYGLVAYASSLEQIGPMARDVSDCAAIMDIIRGKDSFDGTSLELDKISYLDELNDNISGLRIALPKECFSEKIDTEVKEKVLAVAETLKSRGAIIEEITLPFIKYVIPAYYILATAEASSNLARFDGVKYGFRAKDCSNLADLYETTRSEGFGEEVKKRIMLGTFVLSSGYYEAYYKKALQVKALIKQSFDVIFSKYDMVLSPTVPDTAPKLGESLNASLKMYKADIFTVPANIAGLPALSVPCGFDKNHMPIGAQFIGAPLSDLKVLCAGFAYQSITDFHKQGPEVM